MLLSPTTYRRYPASRTKNIPVEEVIHFRFGLDPDNPRKGISRLKTVLREAATDLEASNWTGSLLAHGGLPMGLVTPHGRANFVMSETQLESAKEDMTRKLSGPDRGKPIFVHGPLDFKPFSFDPKTMDLKSIRRLSEERIAANIGFPPIVMNLGAGLDHATYSNYDIAERVAYKRLAAIWRSFRADASESITSAIRHTQPRQLPTRVRPVRGPGATGGSERARDTDGDAIQHRHVHAA